MKQFLILCLVTAFCHPERTAAQSINLDATTTRAVVVGISDYQDAGIPDLRFADKDAEAFANFLRSPAGGSLDGDHLKVLIDSQATVAQFAIALDWLMEVTKEGDEAIIYFSGHGDVEKKTLTQPGFLLCWDAPARVYMAGGALALPMLQEVISTLSIQNKAKVVVITDACRSGTLAGNNVGGAQATAANLAKQYANEIKILSCQPNEYSIEGEQWGGGRGAFSFNLVDALYGLADGNNDLFVTLQEVGRYLEDHVTAEVAPVSQVPMVIGNRTERLASVDANLLAAIRSGKTNQMLMLSPVESRGLEDDVLAGVDTTIRELYRLFKKSLKDKVFLAPLNACADAYYERLIAEPKLVRLHSTMRRNYAAALQDDAQQIINQVLRTDPAIVDEAYSPASKYDHLPVYLHRAGELLGEGHYMHRFIKAREYYFKAKTFRKENYPALAPDSLMQLSLIALDSALTFDSTAAYAYFEKGIQTYFAFGDNWAKESLPFFEKAFELSPQWAWAACFTGISYSASANNGEPQYFEKALEHLEKAISIDSTFLTAYRHLADLHEYRGQANFWRQTFVRKMEEYVQNHPTQVPALYYNDLGNSLMRLGRWEEAEIALLKGAEISNNKLANIFNNLVVVYMQLGKYEEAEKASMKAMEIRPSMYDYAMGQLPIIRYFFLHQSAEEAIKAFRNLIKSNPQDFTRYELLTIVFLENNQLDSAEQFVHQWLALDTIRTWLVMKYMGQVYLQKGLTDKAKEAFKYLDDWKSSRKHHWYPFIARIQVITDFQLGRTDSLEALLQKITLSEESNPQLFFNVATALAYNGQNELALSWLETAFEKGWKGGWAINLANTLRDPDFMYLRRTPEFKALMKKYFPNQAKD